MIIGNKEMTGLKEHLAVIGRKDGWAKPPAKCGVCGKKAAARGKYERA